MLSYILKYSLALDMYLTYYVYPYVSGTTYLSSLYFKYP